MLTFRALILLAWLLDLLPQKIPSIYQKKRQFRTYQDQLMMTPTISSSPSSRRR